MTTGVTIEEIESLMSSKVERAELTTALEIKSNKIDTNINMKAIDILHKQIKHLAVILIEILRDKTMKYMKSENSESALK